MLVNVIYDHGKIIWPNNIKLKNEEMPIVVDVPDEDINLLKDQKMSTQSGLDISSLHPKVKKMMNKINTILGPDYVYHPTDKTDNELFMEALEKSDKYGI